MRTMLAIVYQVVSFMVLPGFAFLLGIMLMLTRLAIWLLSPASDTFIREK